MAAKNLTLVLNGVSVRSDVVTRAKVLVNVAMPSTPVRMRHPSHGYPRIDFDAANHATNAGMQRTGRSGALAEASASRRLESLGAISYRWRLEQRLQALGLLGLLLKQSKQCQAGRAGHVPAGGTHASTRRRWIAV